jgi:5-methylcytosine-specific restriction protein A
MFIPGHAYLRRDLRARYGGQRQGGISTPSAFPLILLFTGESSSKYVYDDGWISPDLFLYSGEGQEGDMQFVLGNRGIRDHIQNGKDLHLFEYVESRLVRYIRTNDLHWLSRKSSSGLAPQRAESDHI